MSQKTLKSTPISQLLKKNNQSLPSAFFVFAGLGAILSLSFYQDSQFITASPPFWMMSLIVPITIYFFYLKFIKVINSLARSFWLGMFFGYGFFTGGLYWLIKAPLEIMALPIMVSLLLFLVLMSFFALSIAPFFMALFAVHNSKKNKTQNLGLNSEITPSFRKKLKKLTLSQPWLYIFVLPSLWTLLEWIRSEVFFMPMLKIAHPQINNFLASLASLFGVYAISFVIWLITGLVFLILKTHPKKIKGYVFVLVLLLTSLFFYNQSQQNKWLNSKNQNFQKFVVVQGNVNQIDKFNNLSLFDEIRRYFYLSKEFKDSIIVWPETAIATFRKNVSGILNSELKVINKNNSIILSGIVLEENDLNNSKKNKIDGLAQQNYYTALANLADTTQNYLKTKLVIFGEYIPFLSLLKPLLVAIQTPFSNYSAGNIKQSPMKIKHTSLASGICFEGAYGRLYARYSASNVLINISNDAWFNNSSELAILFNIIRFRSIEMGKYMIRSANTGISGFINPNGKIIRFLPSYQAGAISMKIPLLNQKTLYSQVRDLPILLISLFFVSLFFVALRTKNK